MIRLGACILIIHSILYQLATVTINLMQSCIPHKDFRHYLIDVQNLHSIVATLIDDKQY